ncbi:hypothetical protein RHS04_07631 [Rhizoctonia solani]|uniref:CxC2-like cysteine cluster KDZ transposase-associated domain-containing protein n=1 Tax=Rhizoctonia solani TaxID=456999 RepID=A0A8H7H1F9_9AGAM|nr:hypothetical protein RHS04_07631 [Rhizoctonia solani]
MSSRNTRSTSGSFRPVLSRHYQPSRRGRVVSSLRQKTDVTQTTSYSVQHQTPDGSGPSNIAVLKHNTSSAAHNLTHTASAAHEFDDMGFENYVDTEPIVSELQDKTKLSPNIQLKKWKEEQAHTYLHALYEHHSAPSPDLTTLADVGLILHLGHGDEACVAKPAEATICVGHTNGFHQLRVSYCGHQPDLLHPLLLLRASILPCTDLNTKLAFTFELLEHFTTFSTLGKTSAYRYYSVLKRLSHTGFPGQVSDRYRELLQAQRKYAYLMALKRAGAGYREEDDPKTGAGLAIRCIACPRPGINFNIDDVPVEERMFFMFWFAFDGNFRNLRKAKKVDKDDMCFTDGLMYFVAHGLYQEWLKTDPNKEPSTDKNRPECDNHKAALDRFVRWAGLDVTGVGACTCARHSSFMPQGLVDFFKGERFAYGDYAIASAIARLLKLGPLEFGMTYDIWCHWSPKFWERASKLPAHLALPSDLKLIGGVPKFHIQGHTEKCRVLHSLNYKLFVGRLEGEGCKRAWAFLNKTAGSTSKKSPGARWDSINYIILDWNFEKNITIAAFLIGKFCAALKSYHDQKAVFTKLDQSLPGKLTIQWRKESIEPYKDTNGRWTSPFFGSYDWGKSLQEVLQQEKEREAKEEQLADTETTKRGLTRWINKGIELENAMDKIRHEALNLKQEGTPRQQNLLNKRREQLSSRITAHHQEREQYLGSLGEPDHQEREQSNSPHPEDSELGLPSSYSGSSLIDGGCLQAPKVEARLRRAVCKDALRTIKNLLGAKNFALQHKRKNVVGEKASTRMEVAMQDLQSKVQRAHRRYNRSCAALLRLDLASTDQETYKLLELNQLRMLSDYLENVSNSLGQRGHAIPWFWRTQAAMNDEQWQIDALKVEWFRARQRYIQWEEELKLLKQEMVMALNGFQYERRQWESKSLQPGLAPGMAEYARQKANFYKQLSVDLYNQCDEHVKNPIVRLIWAENHWPDHMPTLSA